MTSIIDPTLTILAAAMRVQFAQEPAAVRAVDRALEILDRGLPYDFNGVALRVLSYSRSNTGLMQTTDGELCSCESRRRQFCRHRALFRLLLSQWSMTQPGFLRAKLIEQLAPALEDDGYDDQGDFLAQPSREIVPLPASTWALAQDAADALFA